MGILDIVKTQIAKKG
jgi:magnesium-transporting ATPase (P-type)